MSETDLQTSTQPVRSGTATELRLLSPTQDALVDGSAVTLTWTDLPDAVEYHVQVAADADFRYLFFDTSVGNTTLLTLYDTLPGRAICYWRVRTRTRNGWQPWSDPASFTATSDVEAAAYAEARAASDESGHAGPPGRTASAGVTAVVDPPFWTGQTSSAVAAVALATMLLSFAATVGFLFYLAGRM